ncbi:MAG: ABC transporter ATP-binding protein [Anaerolineae bacterium]|nr:ABC transporter ATP-binding protein [Anaerolineae bacterium]
MVRAEGLSRHYTRGSEIVDALADITLDIPRGAFAVVLGPSGCGKSTLLHLLGGIERPSQGAVTVDGVSLERASEAELTRFRRRSVGFIFQFYNLLPFISADENVALPLLAVGQARADALRAARAILDQMGLGARRGHRPAELSGGEQQRVAIARAIITRPPLILADEPTGDLDAAGAEAVVSMLRDLARDGQHTIVMATHNQRLVQASDQVIRLSSGRREPR